MAHEVPCAKLRAAMKTAGYDALVAFSQDNVTYTAGFLVPSHAQQPFPPHHHVLAGDIFAAQIVVNVEENAGARSGHASTISAPTTSSRRTRPTCSPTRWRKRASRQAGSRSSSITCRRRTTSG